MTGARRNAVSRRGFPLGGSTIHQTSRGELKTAVEPLTATTLSYTWDPASQLTGVSYGSGSVPSRTLGYDNLGRLTSDVLRDGSGGDVVLASLEVISDVAALLSTAPFLRVNPGWRRASNELASQ
jgi:hypothetical protein